MKHFANYHGKFDRILRDMGLLDPRDTLAKSGIKFTRPRIEKFLTVSGPNSNVALELARSAAIWSGNARYNLGGFFYRVWLYISVVDPNTVNLDPDPEFWFNLDPDPRFCYKFKKKNVQSFLKKRSFTFVSQLAV